jgi:hypothetical protein
MKKHGLILIIVVVAGLLFGLSFLISKDVFGPTAEKKSKKMNIDERVDSLGKLPFNKDSLITIEGDINMFESVGKINSGKKSSLLANLEYAKQSALVISLKNWFNNSCNAAGIDDLIRTGNACSTKSGELQDLLNTYARYNAVFNYDSKLNSFLAGPYDQGKADALSNGISSAINGEPFRNCPSVVNLASKISSELSAFKYFAELEYAQAELANDWTKIDKDIAAKYKYYNTNYLINLKKLENAN